MLNNEELADANLNLEWEAFLENDQSCVLSNTHDNKKQEIDTDEEINSSVISSTIDATNVKDAKCDINPDTAEQENSMSKEFKKTSNIPKVTPIYISTKTIISYLNKPVDLNEIFWKLPIIQYHIPQEGIIKKQMKIHSLSKDDLVNLEGKLQKENYIDQYIISHIDNPTGRIVFKDVRKISIGLCKKDVLSYRCKKKSAFYNCFVIILRILWENTYKEIHVKIFNTGKLEIPGIQKNDVLYKVLDNVVNTIRSVTNEIGRAHV